MFKEVLTQKVPRAQNMDESNIPTQLQEIIPQVTGAIATGVAGTFFAGNPIAAQLIGGVLNMGVETLLGLFGDDEEYIPNMPPVVTCPPSMDLIADPGRQTAVATWSLPFAHDVEDGNLASRIQQVGGERRGSRFTGMSNIIKYRVYDEEGRKDTCSFYVSVKVIRCQNAGFSHDKYLQSDCPHIVERGTVCNYNCEDGYKLQGASQLTCSDNSAFDRDFPSCQINTCPDPELPPGGLQWSCVSGTVYNSKCSLICRDGYRIDPYDRAGWLVSEIQCRANGTWTEMPVCKDVRAPSFTNCPKRFIREFADRGLDSVVVEWPELRAVDEGAQPEMLTITRIKGPASGSRLKEGAHEVVYEVVDAAGMRDECGFVVNVETRSCRVPQFTDPLLDLECSLNMRHGTACNVSCKHGVKRTGASVITCEARNDEMYWSMPGGHPDCDEKECPNLRDPPNGRMQCSDFTGGRMCNVRCHRGYVPARNANPGATIACSVSTGMWRNADHPGCVKARPPTSVETPFLFYWRATCRASDKDDVTAAFSNFLFDDTLGLRVDCPDCQIVKVRSACISKRRAKYMAVRWSITKPVPQGESVAVMAKKTGLVGTRIEEWLVENFKNLSVVGNTARAQSFKKYNSQGTCDGPLASVQGSQSCAACGAGYEDNGVGGCRKCAANTYQDDSDGLTCQQCPPNSFTVGDGPHAKQADCKSECPVGEYSRNGLSPCGKCPMGTYQNTTRSRRCVICPYEQTTSGNGAVSEDECYPPADAVQRLSCRERGEDFVSIRWVRPSVLNGLLHGFDIEYTEEISRRTVLPTVIHVSNNLTESKRLTSLSPSTTYVIKMWAVTEHGRGREASVTCTTKDRATTIATTPSTPETTPEATTEAVAQRENEVTEPETTASTTTEDPLLCPIGTNSPTGKLDGPGETCYPCQYGFYQDKKGQVECKLCPRGMTTWYRGSTSETDCVDELWTTPEPTTTTTEATTTASTIPCPEGHVSETGFEPTCRACGSNKIPNKLRTRCHWCPQAEDGSFVCTPPDTSSTIDNRTKMAPTGPEKKEKKEKKIRRRPA